MPDFVIRCTNKSEIRIQLSLSARAMTSTITASLTSKHGNLNAICRELSSNRQKVQSLNFNSVAKLQQDII
jgi:hypothetical protein